jgi:hypothetical protein
MRIAIVVAGFVMGASVLWAAERESESPARYSDLAQGSRAQDARPPAPRPPEAPTGSLTFYTSRAVFNAAHPGIPLENLAATNVPPNSVQGCPEPFNNMTNNGCFSPGDILPGISVWNTTAVDLVVLTPPFFGVNCVAVGPDLFADHGEMQFDPPVEAVGFDLNSNVAGPFTVEIFGPGGSLGTTTAQGAIPALFWGVDTTDPGGISRITTNSAAGSGELYCNVAFGFAVPVELQSFEVE